MTAALQLLQSSDFKPYTGKDFGIRFSNTVTVNATLTEVVDLPAYPHLDRKPFCLLFETKQKDHYYPGLYTGHWQLSVKPERSWEQG